VSHTITFKPEGEDGFYPTVRSRVSRYFKDQDISPHANRAMIFKSLAFVLAFVLLYFLILLGSFQPVERLILAVLLGLTNACLLMNIGHDALHQAYSSNKKVNHLLGRILDVLGSNSYLWKIKHNIVHHSHTNIEHYDEDLEIAPGLIRIKPGDKWNRLIRFQHYYAFFLYGFGPHLRVFKQDYYKFFKKKIGYLDNSPHPKIEYFNLFFYKGLYYTLFIVIPASCLPVSFGQILLGFTLMLFVEGLLLGFIFQLAHYVDNVEVIAPENGELAGSWAAYQMRTTSNFANDNPVINFISGGLNFQIEHHLFPQVCHIHYKAISGIVKKTAVEFQIPYHENKKFSDAVSAHLRLLRTMSVPPGASAISTG
jgi:linoleoyl-CoA desaturase